MMQPCSQLSRSVLLLTGNRCPTCTQSSMAGMCSLCLPGIGSWRAAAIIVSVMGGRPVIEGMAPRPCRFCASERDSLHHALLECNAHRILRERWQARTAHQSLDLHVLFCTNPGMNTQKPVKLFRTFASWAQFVKQLMRVKCDELFPACWNGACTYIGVHVSQL